MSSAQEPPAGPEPPAGTGEPAGTAPEPTGRARFRVLPGGRSAAGQNAEPARGPSDVTVDDGTVAQGVDNVDGVDGVGGVGGVDIDPPGPDFRVRCPDCGPQYVAIADVRFVSTGGGAGTDRYLFTCPACGLRVRRPAGPELARILKTSGVATLALRRGTDQAL